MTTELWIQDKSGINPSKIKQYHIFHCIEEKTMFQPIEKQPRKYAGFINGRSLEEAYSLSQNTDAGNWNPGSPQRSTSVGDIIQDDMGFHMVMGMGFLYLCGVHEDEPINSNKPEDYEYNYKD